MGSSTSATRVVALGVVVAAAAALVVAIRPAESRATGIQTVSSVAVPSSGTYRAGDTLSFAVTFSGAVAVTGAPTLGLQIGSSSVGASYVSGSGTNVLTFAYTVQSGQSDTDGITVGTLSLNGGSIVDAGDSTAANLTLNSVGSTTNVLVDAVAPTGSVEAAEDGTYHAGEVLDVGVATSEDVTVNTSGGTPYLSVTVGSTTVHAGYVLGSGSSELTFRYTVQSGDLDTDGVDVGSTLVANGGTIRDAAGNDLVTALTGGGNESGVLVDAQDPSVTSIARLDSSPTNGTSVRYSVTFSKPVTGVDASDFSLTSTGTAAATITGVSGSGASYTVTAGSASGDGTLRLDLNATGTGIADADTNPVAGGFTSGQAYTLDHTAPTITAVAVPSPGTYRAGDALDFTVTTSEPVVVQSTTGPAIDVIVSSQLRPAEYVSGSGTSTLVFQENVDTNEVDTDGLQLQPALDLGGSTIHDAAGNDLLTHLNGVGSLTGVLVDGSAPASRSGGTTTTTPATRVPPAPAAPAAPAAPTQVAVPPGTHFSMQGGQLTIELGSSIGTTDLGQYGYVVVGGNGVSTTEPPSPAPTVPRSFLVQLATARKLPLTVEGRAADGSIAWLLQLLVVSVVKPPAAPQMLPGWVWQLDQWRATPPADRGPRPASAPQAVPPWYWQWAAWHRQPYRVTAG